MVQCLGLCFYKQGHRFSPWSGTRNLGTAGCTSPAKQTNKNSLYVFPRPYLRLDNFSLWMDHMAVRCLHSIFLVSFLPSKYFATCLSVEYWIISSNLAYHFTGYFFFCIQYVTKHADIVKNVFIF